MGSMLGYIKGDTRSLVCGSLGPTKGMEFPMRGLYTPGFRA